MADAMSSEGLEELEAYFLLFQNTISQYIATHLILELCLEAERHIGAWVARRWWEQGVLELEGVRLTERVADEEAEY